jgi:hypothetical protein
MTQILDNFPDINVFDMSESSGLANKINSSSISTFCSNSSCYNVVKLLKLFINPTNHQVNKGLSYVVIGSLENIASNAYIVTRY